jgi:hypothetical protein
LAALFRESQRIARLAVNKFRAEFDGSGIFATRQRVSTPADAIASLRHQKFNAAFVQPAGGGKPGGACADDGDVRLKIAQSALYAFSVL